MLTQICLLVTLLGCCGLADAGFCQLSYGCYKTCYSKTNYYTSCGLFGWDKCTKYRTTDYTCGNTCYKRGCCPGYNGENCDQPICYGSNSCPNGGRCASPDVCECLPGYSQPECADIDECLTTSHGCQYGCNNTLGSFECKCASGYTLDSDQRSCVDINECLYDNGGCPDGCENTEGSYNCTCQTGYTLDVNETSCVDEDECSVGISQCSHLCNNTEGSYQCSCHNGYYLDLDGYTCLDVDECLEGTATCDLYCMNTEGSYTCSCETGYVYGESNECQDIDECLDNVTVCDQVCVNEPGSFHCKCTDGYELTDSSECVDINECEHGLSGCSDECVNVNGSFFCTCPIGYYLTENNKTCEDVDDCLGVVCQNAGICIDGINTFICSCSDGYTGTFCETDIDECTSFNGGCQDMCTNIDGSYNCSCYEGHILHDDGRSCHGGEDVETVFEKYLLTGQLLPQPCYEVLLAHCTDGRDIEIMLASTSEWYTLSTDRSLFYTLGISFVKMGTFYLPVSLQGIEVSTTASSFEIRHSVRFNSSEGMVKESIMTSLDCEALAFDESDMFDFISVDSFTKTQLSSLDSQLPSWLDFGLPDESVISVQDMRSDVIYGRHIESMWDCSGAPVIDNHIYSVFRFGTGFSLNILGDEINLPSLLEGRKFCILADLCMEYGATVFVMIPEVSRDLLLDLPGFETLYNTLGIRIQPRGLGISIVDGIQVPAKFQNPLTLWNGDTMFLYHGNQYADLWIGGDLLMNHDLFTIEGSADIFANIPNIQTIRSSMFLEPWSGKIDVHLTAKPVFKLTIGGYEFVITFRVVTVDLDVYMSIGGDQRNWCGMNDNPTGLYISMFVEVNPFMDIPIIGDWIFSVDQRVYVFVSKISQDLVQTVPEIPKEIFNISNIVNTTLHVIEQALNDIEDLGNNLTVPLFESFTDDLYSIQMIAETDLKIGWDNSDIYSIVNNVDNLGGKSSNAKRTLQKISDQVQFIESTAADTLVNNLIVPLDKIQTYISTTSTTITNYIITRSGELRDIGFKYTAMVKIYGLVIGLVDIELILESDGLFQCSRFQKIEDHMEGRRASRFIGRFAAEERLGLFLIAKKGVGIGGALAFKPIDFQTEEMEELLKNIFDSVKYFKAILQVEVFTSFIGIEVTCDMFVTTGAKGLGLYLYTQGNVWGVFLAEIDLSIEHEIDWEKKDSIDWFRLTYVVKGRLGAKSRNKRQLQTRSDTFQDSYLDALKSIVNWIADDAKKRLSGVQDDLTKAQHAFTNAQNWLEEKKTALRQANSAFDKAISELEKAKQDLRNAKIPFENALDELADAKRIVDNVCKIRKCKRFCIPGLRWKMCHKRIWPGVRISFPCCSYDGCMFSFLDPLCLLANAACQIVRNAAYFALGVAHAALKVALVAFDVAEMAMTAAQYVVDVSRVTLSVAEGILSVAQVGLEFAKGVLEAAKIALEAVKFIIGAAAYVLEFVIEFGVQNILDVQNCGFYVELSTHNLAVFDVSCEVNAFRLGWKKIQITINFKNVWQSIWQAARMTINSLMKDIGSITGRNRRNIEFETTTVVHRFLRSIRQNNDTDWNNLNETVDLTRNKTNNFTVPDDVADRIQSYNDKCQSIQRLQTFLQSAFSTLQDIVNDSMAYRIEIEKVKNDLLQYNISNITSNDINAEDLGIDKEYAFNELNITDEVIDRAIEETNANMNDDPIMLQIKNAANTSLHYIELQTENIESIDYVNIWYTAMDNLTQEYFNDTECNGFRDCMFYTITSFYILYEEEEFPNITAVREAVLDLEYIILESFQNESSTIADSAIAMEYIVNKIDVITQMNPFCADAPTIHKHPRNLTVLIGMDATFNCSAVGDPTPSYWWYKNDALVPGEHFATLTIENITEIDDGSKINCVAGNIVANITSKDAFLLTAESDIDECTTRNGDCEHDCVNYIGSYECICPAGYTIDERNGKRCLDINECTDTFDGEKCEQVCRNFIGGYNCSCDEGYMLADNNHSCLDIDECSNDNGGCDFKCINYDGSYRCICDSGYVGNGTMEDCMDVNECFTGNGGCDQHCTNTDGSFYCECQTGYMLDTDGRGCSDVDECLVDNAGCEHICINVDGGYNCSCVGGYDLESDLHQCTDMNECESNNGGCEQHCNNTMGSFRCSCDDGLKLDTNGLNCIDVDECLVDNGQCNHTCINSYTSFACTCYGGYDLFEDGLQCLDIDECATNTSFCEHICLNTDGSYLCQCNEGFLLNSDGHTCDDLDECSLDNGTCEHQCTNTLGSFLCSCVVGYNLDTDGVHCNDADECSHGNGECDQQCINTPGSYVCDCQSGYLLQDEHHCLDFDECGSSNGGCEQHCSNTDGSFYCGCSIGFSLHDNGFNCTDDDECSHGNGGCVQQCINTPGSYRCACSPGYVEEDEHRCSDIDECGSSNGGCEQHCSNTDGSFYCGCSIGFSLHDNGFNCTDDDECSHGNGGCDQQCINTPGSYRCDCQSGYNLEDEHHCADIDECSSSKGGCEHQCLNTIGSFQCACDTGYELNENKLNCTDFDECKFNNGDCSQICNNSIGSYTCTCIEGFGLIDDGVSCVDNNECDKENGGCEHNCVNTDGSFFCSCMTGYNLDTDGVHCNKVDNCGNGYALNNKDQCADIDECTNANGGCNQQCINTNGSFYCSCFSGYELLDNIYNCTDIDECGLNNGRCDQICENVDGSFKCSCGLGYRLDNDEVHCHDIDECVHANGGCGQTCLNSDGSFECKCLLGYSLVEGNQCMDLDECSEEYNKCDHKCHNTDGSFTCTCRAGFELNGDSISCNDVDECRINNGGCGQHCTNTDGSFICSCPHGFELNDDGINCVDKDECLLNNGGCDHLCVNTPGSFQCECHTGYTLEGKYHCADIDECISSKGGCEHQCLNTIGSFQCACDTGYELHGNGFNCTDDDECSHGNGGCVQQCINTPGSYRCACSPGYVEEDEHRCSDIDECLVDNGECDHRCMNEVGSYRCECHDGYSLGNNGKQCVDVNECSDGNGGCSHQCKNLPGTYICLCDDGFTLGDDSLVCEDVDECPVRNGECHQKCVNTIGSFQCACNPGFTMLKQVCLGVNQKALETSITIDIVSQANDRKKRSIDETKDTLKQSLDDFYNEYTALDVDTFVQSIRHVDNTIDVNYTVIYDLSDSRSMTKATMDLSSGTQLDYKGIPVPSRLYLPDNITDECDVFETLLDGCKDGEHCEITTGGISCVLDENDQYGSKYLMYILPATGVTILFVIVLCVVFTARCIRIRRANTDKRKSAHQRKFFPGKSSNIIPRAHLSANSCEYGESPYRY